MWSCQSGSAGSRWPALEVQSTPVWTIWRSGENLSAGPWLLMFSRVFSVLTCVFFTFRFTTVAEVLQQVREQLQKLQNQKYNSTSASNSPAPLAEIENFTLSLYTKLLSKWDMASYNTDTQTNTHKLSYCWRVLLCCCPAALWWLRNNPSCRVHHNDLWFWRPGWDSQRQWGEAHEKLVRTQLVL